MIAAALSAEQGVFLSLRNVFSITRSAFTLASLRFSAVGEARTKLT
jgi:hypothetical protein